MNTVMETAIGLTDLPVAVLSLIFAILSHKNRNTNWSTVFLFVGISALLGTVAHTFAFSELVNKIIWTVLYLLLFESIRRFTTLLIKSKNAEKYIMISEFSLYPVCLFFLYRIEKNAILVLVLFSVICLVTLVYNLIKQKYKSRYLYLLFGLLISSVVLQILAKINHITVVFEHIAIFSALFTVYQMSKSEAEK